MTQRLFLSVALLSVLSQGWAIPSNGATADTATPAIGHHVITAWVAPDSAWLVVQDRMRLDPTTLSSPQAPLRFLLNRKLAVDAAAIDGQDVTWTESDGFNPKHFWRRPDYASLVQYEHAREIEITPGPQGWSEMSTIAIRYQGPVDDPLTAPEEDYGRSFETTTGLIDSRGAFLAGSTFWVSTVPEHLFTFDLTANVPAEWDAVSQGRLADRYEVFDRRITRFDCPFPMTEMYLVAGPWQQRHERHDDVDIMTYTYARDDALTGRYIDATRGYLDRYQAEIGPYPFTKFALVENFWETGYGMPSFTLLGSTVIRLPFIVHTSYGHEILHCWWGNGVFVDAESGNWCEGLTSYMADYAYKEDQSPEAAADYRRNQLAGYLNYVSDARDIPLTAFRERHSGSTQAIGYGKAMMLFHMLRRRMGDEQFREGLRSFYAGHEFTEASWEDLLLSFERASGEDLGWFHREWIARSGAPFLTLASPSASDTGDGYRVRGEIRQTEPTYRMRVPVAVTTADGSITRKDVDVSTAITTFDVDVEGEPIRVTVDPDFDVFRRLHREEFPPVLSQTLGADSTIIVLPENGPDDLRAAYEMIAERWGVEPGVRVVDEGDITVDRFQGAAVWLLGETSFGAAFASSGPEEIDTADVVRPATGSDELPPKEHTIVITRQHPTSDQLSWTWLNLGDAESAAAIARKVPHYGRYSYLVFAGPQNVAKGTWRIESTPLSAALGDHANHAERN